MGVLVDVLYLINIPRLLTPRRRAPIKNYIFMSVAFIVSLFFTLVYFTKMYWEDVILLMVVVLLFLFVFYGISQSRADLEDDYIDREIITTERKVAGNETKIVDLRRKQGEAKTVAEKRKIDREIIKLEQENARTQIEESRLFDSNLIQEVREDLKEKDINDLDELEKREKEYQRELRELTADEGAIKDVMKTNRISSLMSKQKNIQDIRDRKLGYADIKDNVINGQLKKVKITEDALKEQKTELEKALSDKREKLSKAVPNDKAGLKAEIGKIEEALQVNKETMDTTERKRAVLREGRLDNLAGIEAYNGGANIVRAEAVANDGLMRLIEQKRLKKKSTQADREVLLRAQNLTDERNAQQEALNGALALADTGKEDKWKALRDSSYNRMATGKETRKYDELKRKENLDRQTAEVAKARATKLITEYKNDFGDDGSLSDAKTSGISGDRTIIKQKLEAINALLEAEKFGTSPVDKKSLETALKEFEDSVGKQNKSLDKKTPDEQKLINSVRRDVDRALATKEKLVDENRELVETHNNLARIDKANGGSSLRTYDKSEDYYGQETELLKNHDDFISTNLKDSVSKESGEAVAGAIDTVTTYNRGKEGVSDFLGNTRRRNYMLNRHELDTQSAIPSTRGDVNLGLKAREIYGGKQQAGDLAEKGAKEVGKAAIAAKTAVGDAAGDAATAFSGGLSLLYKYGYDKPKKALDARKQRLAAEAEAAAAAAKAAGKEAEAKAARERAIELSRITKELEKNKEKIEKWAKEQAETEKEEKRRREEIEEAKRTRDPTLLNKLTASFNLWLEARNVENQARKTNAEALVAESRQREAEATESKAQADYRRSVVEEETRKQELENLEGETKIQEQIAKRLELEDEQTALRAQLETRKAALAVSQQRQAEAREKASEARRNAAKSDQEKAEADLAAAQAAAQAAEQKRIETQELTELARVLALNAAEQERIATDIAREREEQAKSQAEKTQAELEAQLGEADIALTRQALAETERQTQERQRLAQEAKEAAAQAQRDAAEAKAKAAQAQLDEAAAQRKVAKTQRDEAAAQRKVDKAYLEEEQKIQNLRRTIAETQAETTEATGLAESKERLKIELEKRLEEKERELKNLNKIKIGDGDGFTEVTEAKRKLQAEIFKIQKELGIESSIFSPIKLKKKKRKSPLKKKKSKKEEKKKKKSKKEEKKKKKSKKKQ
jgi:Ca2+/Na+ antiporter